MMVKLLRGGTQLGAATLARFFALHVLLLPMLLTMIVLLHLGLVIRQGIAPRTAVLESEAPPRTTDPAYAEYYQTRYAKSKGAGVPFWPNIIYKDVIVGVVVVAILVLLARVSGAGLEAPADPAIQRMSHDPVFSAITSCSSSRLVGARWLLGCRLSFFCCSFPSSIAEHSLIDASAGRGGLMASCAGRIGVAHWRSRSRNRKRTSRPNQAGRSAQLNAPAALFRRQQCGSCHNIAGQKPVEKKDDTPTRELSTGWDGIPRRGCTTPSKIRTSFHKDSKIPAFGPAPRHTRVEESRYSDASWNERRKPGFATPSRDQSNWETRLIIRQSCRAARCRVHHRRATRAVSPTVRRWRENCTKRTGVRGTPPKPKEKFPKIATFNEETSAERRFVVKVLMKALAKPEHEVVQGQDVARRDVRSREVRSRLALKSASTTE
jgi:hypothetical protein